MCDTWVVLPSVTESGHLIFAKNSDRPIFDSQPLMRYPRQRWKSDDDLRLEYVTIPQAETTWATLGSSPYWCWGYEEGINEHGVVIGNEAIFTKTFRQSIERQRQGKESAPGLLGMDLIRLGLERGQSAAQAVDVMGALVEQYGQFGSGVPGQSHEAGGYDNSFIIADPDEAWVLEAVGQRWAARRVIEACTSISNQPTIRGTWDAGSADLEAYAQQQGWWPYECPFDFARAYIDDGKPRQLSHMRLMRSRQLLAERAGSITLRWMMRIARDHFEDTFLDGPYFDAADPDFLSLCMHHSPADFTWGHTASSCVVVLPRSDNELPVFWWTPGPPCNGCYVPFFAHGGQLPDTVSRAGTFGKWIVPPHQVSPDEFSPDSYWWLFRRLNDVIKGDAVKSVPGCYPVRNAITREQFDALEQAFEAQVAAVMQGALAGGTVNAAVLDEFTAGCIERVLDTLHGLLDEFDE